MRSIGTCSALLLAAVFAWAAVAKLRTPALTAASFAGIGVPAARMAARVVPVAEVLLAVALVWRPRLGAVLALLALTLFSVVLERARARGVRTGCACFGASRRDSALSTALLRNALLGGAAVAGVTGERGWIDVPALVAVGTAAVIGAVAVTLWDLRSRTGRLWDNRLVEGEGMR